MDYISWIKQVDKNQLLGTYLALVTEPYLWETVKKVLQKDVVSEALLDFNYEELTFMEASIEEIENALESLPMMADKRVVVLEDVPLDRDSVKKAETRLEAIASYLEHENPSTLLFMSYRGAKPFQGKAYKKISPLVRKLDLSPLNQKELENFIEKKFKAKDLSWEKSVVPAITEASAYLKRDSDKNLYDVENMVDQVMGTEYLGTVHLDRAKSVLISDVEDNIFKLMDAISARNMKEAVFYYRGYLSLGQNPHQLFYMVARQIRNLLGVKLLQNARIPDREGQARMKLSPFEYKKLKANVHRFTVEKLLGLHEELFTIHAKSRTIGTDLTLGLEKFLVQACVESV